MNEFEFREIDYDKDLDEIINLIHHNLDQNFTKEFFLWKHFYNPFGRSFGLLGLHEGKIVGLRMFMFWEFVNLQNNKVIKAIRPVDTITDLKYRGKGLFKKLTLEGLAICENDYDIVFNTPNSNSLPGYLKMGWEEIQETREFKIGLLNPFSKSLPFSEISVDKIFLPANIQDDLYETHKTIDFLKWRYKDSKYKVASYNRNLIIYTTGKLKGLNTIIINEMIGDPKHFGGMLNALGRKNRSLLVYFYDSKEFNSTNFIWQASRKKSTVVFKDDQYSVNRQMSFSLGDLDSKL